jgi:hypothetical protein
LEKAIKKEIAESVGTNDERIVTGILPGVPAQTKCLQLKKLR